MKSNLFGLLFLVLLSLTLFQCSRNKVNFKHYGIYLQTSDGFTELIGYKYDSRSDRYIGSKYYNQNTIVAEKNEIELYIYSSKAKLQSYTLFYPIRNKGDSDIKCQDPGANDCPEIERYIFPVESNEELVKITAQVFYGALLLHIKEENEGYVFNVINSSIENHLRNHINRMITLLTDEDYSTFIDEVNSDYASNYDSVARIQAITFLKNEGGESLLNFFTNNKDATISYSNSLDMIFIGDIHYKLKDGNWNAYWEANLQPPLI